MSEPVKVLIVDDSTLVRNILRAAIESDPEFTVVDVAENGKVALQKLHEKKPDAITLDVEMPEMDGLTTLQEIRKTHPDIPIVMVSALTKRGAEVTVDALLAGASDYFAKPSGSPSRDETMRLMRETLLPKLRAACVNNKRAIQTKTTREAPSVSKPRPVEAAARTPVKPVQVPEILAIGSSTGGPQALLEVLRGLPKGFPLPLVIAQHMPPLFTAMLASRLTSETQFHVREGTDGETLKPGEGWIAPGGYHMEIEAGPEPVLALNEKPPENSCRPSVDVLFRSVADIYGSRTISLILTGMGQDGCEGCRAIHARGGIVLAQDEATSVVWGMPRFVVERKLAHAVLPLPEIPGYLARMVATKREAASYSTGE